MHFALGSWQGRAAPIALTSFLACNHAHHIPLAPTSRPSLRASSRSQAAWPRSQHDVATGLSGSWHRPAPFRLPVAASYVALGTILILVTKRKVASRCCCSARHPPATSALPRTTISTVLRTYDVNMSPVTNLVKPWRMPLGSRPTIPAALGFTALPFTRLTCCRCQRHPA